jgi:hypothetical protein
MLKLVPRKCAPLKMASCPVLNSSGGGNPFAQVNNRIRRHSTLAYVSPVEFEQQMR